VRPVEKQVVGDEKYYADNADDPGERVITNEQNSGDQKERQAG
jgi:hypothetical protein